MKIKPRTWLRIAVVVVAIGWFGWQWWGKSHPNVPAAAVSRVAASAIASAPTKPIKPAPPATLHMGRLTLTACQLKQPTSAVTTPAFCAKFPVPENRADPKSRTIDLSLAIVKSASQVPDKDLVTYLAGGPGQSAVQTYPELAPAFAPLLKTHDVLLLDQRGTGDSHPLLCPDTAKKQAALPASASTAQRTTLLGQCLAEVEKTSDPRDYTTTAAIADLEAVRQALGAPKLDLVGVSYGTRVAQHYAAAYPHAVRSIVLDGVVPNQLVLGETFATALQHSLKLQAAACTATPACHKAFGDWYATLHQLYAKLKAGPAQPVSFRDPTTYKTVTETLDADTLGGVVRLFSYSTATAALLPLAVTQAAHGDYAPLMGQAKIIEGSVDQSIQSNMQLSVVCTEDAPLLKPRPQSLPQTRSGDAGLLLSGIVQREIDQCKVWPHAPMPKNFHAPFKSSIPTLLISGERDPVTPPAFATEVLQGLTDGRSLVVKGMGHAESIRAGCMPTLVNQFVDKLKPKQLDAQCLEKLGPTPAFVNFNGAAP